MITTARVDEIAGDHGVHRKTRDVGPRAPKRATRGLRVVRGLRERFVRQHRRDRAGHAVGSGHVPGALARGETEPHEERVTTRDIDVGVKREDARLAELRRNLICVDIGHERGLDRRRGRGCGFQTELQLPAPGDVRRGRDGCGRREVLIRRREPRHETAELEVAEELEHRRTVVRGPTRSLELEGHR